MPTLAPAPCPRRFPPAKIDLPSLSFLGRSLAEYARLFALDVPALKGRDVLDVAAGPSSFTAEACARKICAAAVDPRYDSPAEILAAELERDQAALSGQLRAKPRLAQLAGFPSVAAAEADRGATAQRFLADYASHFIHNRYVCAALPRLPFFDGTFDLVLCGQLLFLHPARFDFDWHLAACRELARVSAAEVRIAPLGVPGGAPYPALTRLRRELREGGMASEVRSVTSEFSNVTHSLLVLRRTAS